MELGLSPGDFVLDGDPALPSPKISLIVALTTLSHYWQLCELWFIYLLT